MMDENIAALVLTSLSCSPQSPQYNITDFRGSFFVYFSIRLLSLLRGHSFFLSPPQRPITSNFEGFLSQILYIFVPS